MKAMVLTGLRAMEAAEVPDPVLQAPDEVLLRVGSVGVCGSDIHYYKTGRIGSQVVRYPYRVGHEFSAVVLEVGPKVARLRPGDRVAVDPAMPCHVCDQCRLGREHTCRNLRFLGCPGQAEGCLSEYMVMPASCCFPVGPEVTLDEAALVEPLSIGVYAVRSCLPLAGARIGILGSGPIGLSVLLAARAAGVGAVYVTDKIDARLVKAVEGGADWTGNPLAGDVVGEVVAREPLLLDVVFECCGEQEALDQAVELLKPGGRLMVVGIPTEARVSFSADLLRRKEVMIQNIRRQNGCMPAAVALLSAVPAGLMLTHHFPLAEAKAAFDCVAAYADGVVKAMIRVSEDR